MPVVSLWSKVQVQVQTVLGAPINVTAVTKANPAVATTATNTFAVGNYVLISSTGMSEIDNRVVRVQAATATSVTFEGVDSTNFGTFVSGTVRLVTFGASASTFVDVSASGGEAADIDGTTIHDDISKLLPGVKSALQYSFTSLWDPADPALIELKKADDVKGQRAIMVVFANNSRALMYGYCTAPLVPTGSTGETVKTPVSVKVSGAIQSYTT